MSLTFEKFCAYSTKRNRDSFPGCKDWDAHKWLTAIIGELGEFANMLKKLERGDFADRPNKLDEYKEEMAKELADAVLYMPMIFEFLGQNLEQCVIDKFNEVSARSKINSPLFLGVPGKDY